MPTYHYRCRGCRHEFEEFQSMKADPLRSCPSCHKEELERVIGAGGGMIFKGTGFYLTDYKGSGGTAKGGTESAGGTKSETPPAPAPEKKGTETKNAAP
ncbi:MAG: zinc ribbon domain-containing protein [Bacteroidetes bacterium]|nr:MAG: zinc ribbon domain-containing protein [Bacteroidota bacterium]